MIWLGIAYAVALTIAYACILAGKAADTLDNTTDEHSQFDNFGIGGGAFHAVPNTHREQHDHG